MFTYSHNPKDIRLQNKLQTMAREFRKNPTVTEQKLWKYLRGRKIYGYKFRRQHPVLHYIVDFYCHEKKLIIEADGSIHTNQQARDQSRDVVLQQAGYTVIRFTNDQVLHQIDDVLQNIIIILSPFSHKEKGVGG